ncbi:hypothetical protein [Nocardioides sambongensis]|uniref:hypothetical protein n=1 Tax=Nocardioides sambongensis TaxID=2589074 RepID=UPI001E420243|nr:hypothetical protein [Nocardioides sambongensis]
MDLHLTRPGVVAPVRIDPTGRAGPRRGEARGRRWRTTSPRRVVPAEVDAGNAHQRIAERVAAMPAGCAATGWAALHWQGERWFNGIDAGGEPLAVPIATGDQVGLRQRDGLELLHGWLFDDDVIAVDGLPITRPERSVFNAVTRAPWFELGLQVAAMACAADLVSLRELARYTARLGSRQHIRRMRMTVELADENLWSPMEATMLLRWIERGHPRPLANRPVFDRDGRHLLTPDLLDPAAGVVGQYDGTVHDLREVRRRDLAKEETCRELGLQVVTMISTDLRDEQAFGRRLDAAYRRAGEVRGRRRAWTIEQPPRWVDTSTVALRRGLDDEQRRRWLGWRVG